MNIQDIKASISHSINFPIASLDINSQKDADGIVDPNWVSAWIAPVRVRISMHKEVFDKIVADRAFNGLAVKPVEHVTPVGKEAYRRFVVITPTTILASF